MYDILIRNGLIIDGTGEPGRRGDIGVRGDRIYSLGDLSNEKAKREIDAAGLVVAPGFIDVQNHSDGYGALFENPALESMIRQGITTALVGHCGSSLAPLLSGSLASIQKWASIEGININWSSMAEFLRWLDTRHLGVNIATLIGHATLRRDFVGDESRALNAREKGQIERLYRRSLREGGWGLSIGLEYVHGRASGEQELIDLLKLTSETSGVVSFHLRDEGEGVASSVQEAIYLARKSGVRIKISHFKKKSETNPELAREILASIDKAVEDGLRIWLDVYPYTTSTAVLYLFLPEWATESGKEALLEKLKNENLRKEIVGELASRKLDYSMISVAAGSLDSAFLGKTIGELAARRGISPEEVVLDLLALSRNQVLVFVKNLHEPVVELFLAHPRAMIATDGAGLSASRRAKGGLAHPRSFGATARALGRYVREKKILSLEQAIHKMTGMPAGFVGLKKRGFIKRDNYADLVVFDPEKIADRATFENPYRYPDGINFVVLNGRLALENGTLSDPGAGRVIAK